MKTTTPTMTTTFRPLQLSDREAIQTITLLSPLQNCNNSFGNLFGWSALFNTHVSILKNAVVFRYHFGENISYLINASNPPDKSIVEHILADATSLGKKVRLIAVEERWIESLQQLGLNTKAIPQRDQFDYIYLRNDLEHLAGKNLKAKRNHLNNFISQHPNFEYRPLSPDLFNQCMMLEHLWSDTQSHQNPQWGNTIEAEQQVMEKIFRNWNELDMLGGAIFTEDGMVAFSYGCPINANTFDICVEKADRNINGAFNIINQQFVAHLPVNFEYINREEDMGIEGLRKAKMSYHPYLLLPYYSVTIE